MAAVGGKGKPRTKKVKELPPIAEVVASLVEEVRRAGAAPKSAVTKAAGSSARALEVFDGLAAAGLETGARSVRVPLDAQLEAAVRARGPALLRALSKEVCGATPAEAAEAARGLVDRGRLRLVARQRELLVTADSAGVLDGGELEKLARAVASLGVSLATAKKSGASLLVAEVEPLLRAFQPSAASGARAGAGVAADDPATSSLEAEVVRHREPSGLTSVPRLVRALGGEKARDAIHAALLRGARAGRLELRPESGMGRLSPEELALCLPGPQGTHLSWVRSIAREESR